MSESSPDEDPQASDPRSLLGRHPVITSTFVLCTLAGAVLGFVYLSGEWSAARRIAAGAVAGGGSALLITATKMIG